MNRYSAFLFMSLLFAVLFTALSCNMVASDKGIVEIRDTVYVRDTVRVSCGPCPDLKPPGPLMKGIEHGRAQAK